MSALEDKVMKRRNFLKTCGLSLAAGSISWPARLRAAEPEPSRPGLRVLTCNIRWMKRDKEDARFGHSWPERREACAEILRKQQADIVCFQECYAEQLNDLRGHLPGYAAYAMTGPGATSLEPINAILYREDRFDLVSAAGYWLSKTPEVPGSKSWNTSPSRLANWVRLKERAGEREFRVINTHLAHRREDQLGRENQAKVICADTAAYPADYPQILTGDMNCASGSPAIEAYKAAGWKDTYETVHGAGEPGFTWHAFQGPRFVDPAVRATVNADYVDLSAPVKEEWLRKIDWIFTRGAVASTAASVIRDEVGGKYPSDHYFVSADLTFLPSS